MRIIMTLMIIKHLGGTIGPDYYEYGANHGDFDTDDNYHINNDEKLIKKHLEGSNRTR